MRKLLGLLLLMPLLLGATKHVATTGADAPGCGAVLSPCRTPVYCMNSLGSGGDICTVHVGTYTSTGPDRFGPTITKAGANGNPNVLTAFGDGTVTLDTDNEDARDTMRISASDIKMTNIVFRHRLRINGGDRLTLQQNTFKCPGGNDNGSPDWSNYASIFSESLGFSSSNKYDDWAISDNRFLYDSSCTADSFPTGLALSFIHLYSVKAATIEHNDFIVSAAVTAPTGKLDAIIGLKECNQDNVIRFNYIAAEGDGFVDGLWDFNNSPEYGCVANGENLYYQNLIRANGATYDHCMTGAGDHHSDAHFYNNTCVTPSVCVQIGQDGAAPVMRRDEVFNNICYGATSFNVRWQNESVSQSTYMDRNDYSAPSIDFKNLGSTYTDYSAWKTAIAGVSRDQNSQTVNPGFVNSATGDFRLIAGSPMLTGGRGTPYSDILGAYITGSEAIGCTTDPLCHGSGAPVSVCGDGVISSTELCDGSNIGGATCADIDPFTGGTLTCQMTGPNACKEYVTTACYFCGDGVVNSGEQCDGSVGSATCHDVNAAYDGGTLLCDASSCQYNTTLCTTSTTSCNGSAKDADEQCDGTHLGGKACSDRGYTSGPLACNDSGDTYPCTFDYSGCTLAAFRTGGIIFDKQKRTSDAILDDPRIDAGVCRAVFKDWMPANSTHVNISAFDECISGLGAKKKRAILELDFNNSDRSVDQTPLPAWSSSGGCATVHDTGTSYWPVWWDADCQSHFQNAINRMTTIFDADPRVIGYFATGYSGLLPTSLAGEQSDGLCDEYTAAGYDCACPSGQDSEDCVYPDNVFAVAIHDMLDYFADHTTKPLLYTRRNEESVPSLTSTLDASVVDDHDDLVIIENGLNSCENMSTPGTGIIGKFLAFEGAGKIGTGFSGLAKNQVAFPRICGGKVCDSDIIESDNCVFDELTESKLWRGDASKTWSGHPASLQNVFVHFHPADTWRGLSALFQGYKIGGL